MKYETTIKVRLIKCMSTYVPFLIFLIMIDRQEMTPVTLYGQLVFALRHPPLLRAREQGHRDAQYTRVHGKQRARPRACNGIRVREIDFECARRRTAALECESICQACHTARRPICGTSGTSQLGEHSARCRKGRGAQLQTPANGRTHRFGRRESTGCTQRTYLLLLSFTLQILEVIAQPFQCLHREASLIILAHIGLTVVASHKLEYHAWNRGRTTPAGASCSAVVQGACVPLWSTLPVATLRTTQGV